MDILKPETLRNLMKKNEKDNYLNKINSFLEKLEKFNTLKSQPPLKNNGCGTNSVKPKRPKSNEEQNSKECPLHVKRQVNAVKIFEKKVDNVTKEKSNLDCKRLEKNLRTPHDVTNVLNFKNAKANGNNVSPLKDRKLLTGKENQSDSWNNLQRQKKATVEETMHCQSNEKSNKPKKFEVIIKQNHRKLLLEKESKKIENLNAQHKMAKNHYLKSVLRRSWTRWIAVMKESQKKILTAKNFHEKKMKYKILKEWNNNVKVKIEQKQTFAKLLYEKLLLKNYFSYWRREWKSKIKLLQVAVDWNDFKISEKFFHQWLSFTMNEQLQYIKSREMAEIYYNRKLKEKFFNIMRNYPNIRKQELAIERRKNFWRLKVQQILPDYCPLQSFDSV